MNSGLVCTDCGQSDKVTYGPNTHGIWIGCIRCQNARDGYKNVPEAERAWQTMTRKEAA